MGQMSQQPRKGGVSLLGFKRGLATLRGTRLHLGQLRGMQLLYINKILLQHMVKTTISYHILFNQIERTLKDCPSLGIKVL